MSLLLVLAPVAVRAELPPEAQAALEKGIMAAKEQEWMIAIQSFEKARKAAPDAPVIFFNLGLAESKIPGRELRAIAWFGAYLAAEPSTPNAAAVKDQIARLRIKQEGSAFRLVKQVQDTARSLKGDKGIIALADLWAKAGDFSAALSTAGQINEATSGYLAELHRSDAYWSVARIQARNGDFADALSTASLATYPDYKCGALLDIGRSQLKAGDVAGAKTTLGAGVAHAAQITSPVGRARAMQDFATAQADAGDIVEALKTVARMQGEYYDYDKSLAQAYIAEKQVAAGDIAGAKTTLATALQAVNQIPDAKTKSSVQSALASGLATITKVQAEAGDIAGAMEIAKLNSESSQRPKVERPIMAAQIKAAAKQHGSGGAQTQTARATLASAWKITDSWPQDQFNYKSLTLREIAEMQVKVGDISGAQRSASGIQEAGYKNIANSAIADAQMESGDLREASKTIEHMQDSWWLLHCLENLAAAQAKSGDVTGAFKTVDRIQGTSRKDGAYGQIARALAASGDLPGAFRTVDRIQDASNRDNPLVSLAEAQAKGGDFPGAFTTSDRIRDALWKNSAYQRIAVAQAESGDFSGAFKTADLATTDRSRCSIWLGIAKAQSKAGNRVSALKTCADVAEAAASIKALIDRLWVQRDLALTLAVCGDVDSAVKSADSLQEVNWRSSALGKIAEVQSQSGDVEGARKTFGHALTIAAQIQDVDARRGARDEIVSALEKAGIDPSPAIFPQLATDPKHSLPPAIKAADWLKKLDDNVLATHECPLNTEPFLDLAGYLKSLPPSDDPQKVFEALKDTAMKLVEAQHVVVSMLKQQALQEPGN